MKRPLSSAIFACVALLAVSGCRSAPADVGEAIDPSLTLVVDSPAADSELPLVIAGWGADLDATAGTGADRVEVLQGGCNGPVTGVAQYGLHRADVGQRYGAQFIRSGWEFVAQTMSAGEHRLGVRLVNEAGLASTCETVTVKVQPKPMLSIEMPKGGSHLLPIRVSGWAADLAAASGTGVARVDVLDGGCDGKLLGVAEHGLIRGDVAERYGHQFGTSGWELIVDDLSVGRHTLGVRLSSEATSAAICLTVEVSVL